MVTTTAKGLHLISLEIENLLRVQAFHADPRGNHLTISGPNHSGKTSILDAIWLALGGKVARQPKDPIHHGADRAYSKLELGRNGQVEWTVERTWTESGTRLSITGGDGSEVRRPGELLEGLIGRYAMNAQQFLAGRPQDQLTDLIGICGVEPPVKAVEKITGESYPPKSGETAWEYLQRLCADETGLYYVSRREAHAEAERRAAALLDHSKSLQAAGGPLSEGEKEESPSSLARRLQELHAEARRRQDAQQRATDAERELADAERKVKQLEQENLAALAEAQEIERQIAALQAKLTAKRESIAATSQRIANAAPIVAELKAEALEANDAAKKALDPSQAIAAIQKKMQDIDKHNEQLVKRRLLAQQLEQAAKLASASRERHKQLDDVMKELRDLRGHLLDDVDLGVEGLSVGDGELLLNGVTFAQASLAESWLVAIMLGLRQNPEIKILRLDNAEKFDDEALGVIYELAERFGFQVLRMEVVRGQKELKVEIVEGVAA